MMENLPKSRYTSYETDDDIDTNVQDPRDTGNISSDETEVYWPLEEEPNVTY